MVVHVALEVVSIIFNFDLLKVGQLGGGGTFVVDSDTMKPLIIGGGGNGANWYSWTVQSPVSR